MIYPPSFFLAMLANFLFFASMHLLLTPLPLYIRHLGGRPSQVGLATGAFTLSAILARPLAGRWVDTWGRKRTLLLGAAIFALSPLLYALSGSVSSLLLIRMLPGLGLSFFTTAYIILVADLVPSSHRGEAIGVAGISPIGSLMVAPALGASLLDLLSFRPLFLAAGLIALLSWLVLRFVQEPEVGSQGHVTGQSGWAVALQRRSTWVPFLAAGVIAITYGTLTSFLPLFAAERGIGNAGLFFTAYAITSIVMAMPMGRFSDRVGRTRVILPAMIALAPTFWLLTRVYELPWLLAVATLYGVSFGSARLAMSALVIDETPLEGRGTATSLFYAGFDLGIGVGSFLMGLVAEAVGYGGMYEVVGGLCLLGAATFILSNLFPQPR